MKRSLLWVMLLACGSIWSMQSSMAATSTDEAKIHQLLDNWVKAFRAHDLDAIMSMYAPGVVAFDIAPPLQYVGVDEYKKDYKEFLDQFEGPIEVEYRDLHIVAGKDVAFATGLERMMGTMKNGQKFDSWVRFTSGFQKIKGQWKDTHDHVSVPVDFDTGKALLELKP